MNETERVDTQIRLSNLETRMSNDIVKIMEKINQIENEDRVSRLEFSDQIITKIMRRLSWFLTIIGLIVAIATFGGLFSWKNFIEKSIVEIVEQSTKDMSEDVEREKNLIKQDLREEKKTIIEDLKNKVDSDLASFKVTFEEEFNEFKYETIKLKKDTGKFYLSFIAPFDLVDEAKQADRDLEEILSLIKKGVSIDSRGESQSTALIEATRRGDSTLVEFLLEKGANPNMQDAEGNTALMHSVLNSNHLIFQALLRRSADINIKNNYGRQVFIESAQDNSGHILNELISIADINDQDNMGRTALMEASEAGLFNNVQSILDHKGSVNLTMEDGITDALYSAIETYSADLVEFNVDFDTVISSLLSAEAKCERRHWDKIVELNRCEIEKIFKEYSQCTKSRPRQVSTKCDQ